MIHFWPNRKNECRTPIRVSWSHLTYPFELDLWYPRPLLRQAPFSSLEAAVYAAERMPRSNVYRIDVCCVYHLLPQDSLNHASNALRSISCPVEPIPDLTSADHSCQPWLHLLPSPRLSACYYHCFHHWIYLQQQFSPSPPLLD